MVSTHFMFLILFSSCYAESQFVNRNDIHLSRISSDKCDCSCSTDLPFNQGISNEDVIVYTVASEKTEGYERYIRSANVYGIDVKVLGLNEPWRGGDMTSVGGGYKINLLKDALKKLSTDDKDKLILFTDSYDVIFVNPLKDIIRKFRKLNARVLFSAEQFCWPDTSLESSYPSIDFGNRFLNSGMFIGYLSDVKALLETSSVDDKEDDQLFYTKLYLNDELRKNHDIKLDHHSELFFNLNGATKEGKIKEDADTGDLILENEQYYTYPAIVHGNGPSKVTLNTYGNYLAQAVKHGECESVKENLMTLDDNNLPTVSMALFVENPQPFFEEFLDKISKLNYPKNKINLFVHNNVPFHENNIEEFIKKHNGQFKNIKTILEVHDINEYDARNLAVEQAKLRESDYLFVIDSDSHIDNPETLRILLKQNKYFVGPLLVRPGSNWSNFWGAIAKNGYYQRSFDYVTIMERSTKGIFNIPFITGCYLAKKEIFHKMVYNSKNLIDPDMALCESMRSNNIFMHVLNTEDFGHLVNNADFDVKRARPDFYTIFTNKQDWEARYIHPNYSKQFDKDHQQIQPCTDVYWFAIASDQFCDDLINITETFGQWSSGKNEDDRLAGGYEAVPTRDIHMNQVGLDRVWLKFLQDYVRPLQELVFIGYYHNPPQSLMNFIVRYRPDEQPSLRPHHDSSTYTINIALNRVGIDYEGGGCRFLRYNCSVTATKKGWLLMHPGRLTHMHEGLPTTKGTRYIMVSFINP